MEEFIRGMPKAELHVHLEGTLEPEHIFALADRNQVELAYKTPAEVVAAYDFHDLPSFLGIYYAAMAVLHTEEDFFELAYQYFERAHKDNIVYVEPFFDPQAHTSRGVSFDTIINGIHRAQVTASEQLGIESNLIMCFLRDWSAESAMEHLSMSLPYRDWIIGVGLDSDEKDNPPSKFAEVFAEARQQGYKLTMHCDVNQVDIVDHIWQCLNDIDVDRIDHGINSLEDEALCQEIARRELGLTVCPVSNRFVVQSLTSGEIKTMLARGMKVSIHSDDPGYFRAYLTDNYLALIEEAEFSQAEILQLGSHAFETSWLNDEKKQHYLGQLRSYAD
ncbi:MAG: adenosine deaminase [Gammaproteobacteria bacterium]|jgi:adenosine deaminase|nr:adenosine deaminase [Gammaproteobacteria bacterium]MBT5205065.1 adenosine deaminase [Gammaproteobacteria bacterium]MBT6246671.1 adenosine deaminase [Gammaproteobacteria bacterium]